MFKWPPKYPTIKVTVKPGKKPNFEFVSPDVPWDGSTLTFCNDGHNGFYVSFTIQNAHYYFPQDKDAALSARKVEVPGNECPDQYARHFPQFSPYGVSEDLKTLIVHDPNAPGQECVFSFSLFVTTDSTGGGPYLRLDPVGNNQNGGVKLDLKRVLAAAAVVVAAGAVAYAASS